MASLRVVEIYTDGSADKSSLRDKSSCLGIGAYCKYNDNEYSLSALCDSAKLSACGINSTEVSNPTAEFVAFVSVLELLVKKGSLPKNVILRFHIDYIGVEAWISGKWQAKKPYIKTLKTIATDLISKIGCPVEIHHVKGHSGVYGNEMADKLALAGRLASNEPINTKTMSSLARALRK